MKTALVTGAASGIGEAFSHRLAEDGYALWLVDIDEVRLSSVTECIEKQAAQPVRRRVLDLTDSVALEPLLTEIREHDGFDLVINNAGIGTNTRGLLDTDREEVRALIHLHNLATVEICHAALPAMVERRKGAVINLSSTAILKAPRRSHPVYSATKTFVKVFSEALHHELKPHGIVVQALIPSWTHTNIVGWTEARKRTVPRFLWMTPMEVVEISLRDLPTGHSICYCQWGYRMHHKVRGFPLIPALVKLGLYVGLNIPKVWNRLREVSPGFHGGNRRSGSP